MLSELDRLKLGLAQCEAAFAQNDPVGAIAFVAEVRARINKLEIEHPGLDDETRLRELESPELIELTKAFEERYNNWCAEVVDRLKISSARFEATHDPEDPLTKMFAGLKNEMISGELDDPDLTSSHLLKSVGGRLTDLAQLLKKYEDQLHLQLEASKELIAAQNRELRKLRFERTVRQFFQALALGTGVLIGDILAPFVIKGSSFNPYISALKFAIVVLISFFVYRYVANRHLQKIRNEMNKASIPHE